MTRKALLKIIVLIIVSTLFLSERDATAMAPEDVSVDSVAVVMPVGRVLLIKGNRFLGAIKFVQNEVRQDGVYSKYEYYEYGKGGFLKIKNDVIFRKVPRKTFWFNLRSLFFNDLSVGPNRLKLKPRILFADAADEWHSTVYFWVGDWYPQAKPDHKVQLAPTPLNNISQVDLDNKKIRWFGYEEKKERIITPIDKIWD